MIFFFEINIFFFLVIIQAIDDDSNQTGQMVAGLLSWPQVNQIKYRIDYSFDLFFYF